MDTSGTTFVGLVLLAFFTLLLVGGLVLVGALGVIAYRTFRATTEPSDERQGCLAAVLLGALLAFLGALGLTALLAWVFLSTITGAAGIVRSLPDEEPEPVVITVPADPEPERMSVVAEVKGSLDPELVQRLTDIATRRRELDLRVRSRQGADEETWVYEFVLPPVELDPQEIQAEMRAELEGLGHVPISLESLRD